MSSGPVEDREFDTQTDFRKGHYPPVPKKQFISDIDPHANCVSAGSGCAVIARTNKAAAKADVVECARADDLIGIFGTNFNITKAGEPSMLPAIPIQGRFRSRLQSPDVRLIANDFENNLRVLLATFDRGDDTLCSFP